MIALTSEHDLWRLFGGEGPETQGAIELAYSDFYNRTTVLDIASKRAFRPRFSVSDPDRFYLLRSPHVEAVVDQARLYATADKIGGPDLRVAYLGMAQITEHHTSVPANVQQVERVLAETAPTTSRP